MKVGDKAIAEQIIPCGECYFCRRGAYNLCDAGQVYGITGPDGGWAEYMKYTRKSIVHKVPNELPWEVAVAIEPLACAVHGVEKARIELDDTVALLGVGAIGLFMLQIARLKSPKLLIVADVDEHRLSIARKLGADVIINSQQENVVRKVRELTGRVGCDVVLEASGHPAAVDQAISMLRKQGRMMEFGVFAEKASVDFSMVGDVKELEIVGAHMAPFTYPTAIRFLAQGLVKTGDIITHNFPLKDWKQAVETAGKRLDNSIKVTMTPG